MKRLALALAATSFATAPAFAGAYVNVESNAGYTGSEYDNRTTDLHVGFEGGNDTFGYYIQGGPAIVADEGDADTDSRLSGKTGLSVNAGENLNIYGEISVLTPEADDDDKSWGTKLGAKYSF
jgi:hypothetical protein